MTPAEKALLQTLAYSSVFNFPLTKPELWQFLITDKVITREDFEAALKDLPKQLIAKDGFYTLADDVLAITTRKKNKQELEKKLRIAKRAAFYLSYIPSIQLIGISGGVAIGKADTRDDIDFFIVTKKNTLFMTRVWIHAILEMLNLRRKRLEIDAQDKICVNLLVDERQLAWPENLHDIYTAHEIAHMKPLFDRNNTYNEFRKKNMWIEEMLPNAFEKPVEVFGVTWERNYFTLQAIHKLMTLRPFEKLAGLLQKYRMKRFRTTETVTERLLAFHPVNYRERTLDGLHKKLQQLGLLTNN